MEKKTSECPVEILRREMGLENGLESDDVVYKREIMNLEGVDVSIRRVFVVYGSYRVGWVHDADISHCMVCRSDFGFFKRKHHCRACGLVVCSSCSPYRAQIPSLEEEDVERKDNRPASRVCNNCFGLKIRSASNLAPKSSSLLENSSLPRSQQALLCSANANGVSPCTQKKDQSSDTVQSKASKKKEKRAEIENLQFQLLEEPKYSKAYRRMRGIIPPFIGTINLKALLDTGLPKAVAERIWSKRSLWLIIMHPDDIHKVHIADLRSKYTPIGLDLTERYAVWHNLPNWEVNEKDGDTESDYSLQQSSGDRDKVEWKTNFKVQMDEMARKHARNELSEDLVRHSAYSGHEPIHLFSHRAAVTQLYNHRRSGSKHVHSQRSKVPNGTTSNVASQQLSVPELSPTVSTGSSLLSTTPPPPRQWRHIDDDHSDENNVVATDDVSPVVPLFVHRTCGRDDGDSGLSSGTDTPSDSLSQEVLLNSSSTGSLPPTTMDQQKQKREERIQERKRRASRELQSRSSESAGARTIGPKSNSGVLSAGDPKLKLLSQVLSTPIEVTTAPVPSLSSSPELEERVDQCETPHASSACGEGDVLTPMSGSRQRRNSSKNNSSEISSVLMSNLIESELPQLTATPLRDLMADNNRTQRKNVVEVMERMRVADIKLESKEATELLKYAVVNLMDMREDGVESESDDDDSRRKEALQDEEEYENAMLSIIDILVMECGADLDTLDRDGNNLLTFLQHSVTPDMHMSSRLVPALLRVGMNILAVKERKADEEDDRTSDTTDSHSVVLEIHPLFVSLSMSEKEQLIAHFSGVSSVELNHSQKFTYFALLVVIGRASLASLVMGSVRDILTHEVASALVKVCRFDSDSMEDPLETFELLDQHGAKF
eukprot:CAMPEP_0114428252 /NCGR_PEP_ID=MMETSP0103-20121206/8824_1 /TAXON_ID=37642 ORGANISM="Paraphysomonas imperforata, Strain PA2" /NCGR_SAMPLE_ID=MMETSP0103 /ASSEMBLY_ACC=CAM_ASM_000201 /LENGTH=887 /DNA_ID=CAMNT_0001597451 /DNA_START=65 /DNA_END=2728 /DNA_ORIENTATION=+